MINTTKIYYLHRGDEIPFYIGKTKIPLIKRIYRHKLKFGDYIQIEEIDQIPTKEWKFWEKHYISLFKSWGFQLENGNNGGGGLESHSDETKRKISLAWKNKSLKELNIINDKRRIGNIGKVKKGAGRNTKYTNEEKIALGNRSYYKEESFLNKMRKSVVKINKNTLEIIKEYNSLTSASLDCGIGIGDISNVCNGYQKTAGGFIWKYKKDVE